MHLQVGDMHGIIKDGKIVLVPCRCLDKPYLLSEVKLPASAAALFPQTLSGREDADD